MLSLTNKQQRDLLIALGIGDFLVGGKITLLTRKAVTGFLRTLAPPAGRSVIRGAPRLGGTILVLARRHPIIFASALAYAGYVRRDEVGEVVEDIREGVPEVVEMLEDLAERQPRTRRRRTDFPPRGGFGTRPTDFPPRVRGSPEGITLGAVATPTKKPTTFNKAVKAGMLAVKKSPSYGGKGKIKPAKKAFAVVVKLASAKKRKKKAPKSGIRLRIWRAMKGLR
jgi:hypothetical protein